MAERPAPFSPEDMARRKKRALVMALVLAGMMAMFYITTIVRIGGLLAERVP
jgi:accessory gene regulator protein AgrB